MDNLEAVIFVCPKAQPEAIALAYKILNAIQAGVVTNPDMVADLMLQHEVGVPDGRVLRDPDKGRN